MDSAETKTTTTIDVTFSEDLTGASVVAADFTLNLSLTVQSVSEAAGVVTITTTAAFATDATPTVTLANNGVDDASAATNTLAAGGNVVATDGVAPTMDSAETKTTTTIDVTFSEDLDGTSVTSTDFTLNLSLTVSTAVETSPGVVTITTTTAFASDALPTVTLAGNGVNDDSTAKNTLAAGPFVVATDGTAASMDSAVTIDRRHIEVTFSEDLSDLSVIKTDFLLDGKMKVEEVSELNGVVTIKTKVGFAPDFTPTITLDPNGVIDISSNVLDPGSQVTATDGVAQTNGDIGESRSQAHKAPTMGLSLSGERLVENGLGFNGYVLNVDRLYTPFDKQIVEVGVENTIFAKFLVNSQIQSVSFMFGVPQLNQVHLAEAVIAVYLSGGNSIKEIKLMDKGNLIDENSVSAIITDAPCKEGDTKNRCKMVITVS